MAVQFIGSSSQYLSQPANLSSAFPWSMAMWVNPSAPSGTQAYAGISNSSTPAWFGLFNITGQASAQNLIGPTNYLQVNSLQPAHVGSWNHVVAVYPNATSVTVYLNGVAASISGTAHTPTGLNRTLLGALDNGAGVILDFFTGSMAYPAIWNGYALTPNDVSQLYNGGTGYDPTLLQTSKLSSFSEFSAATQLLDRITDIFWQNHSGVSIVADPFSLLDSSTVCATGSLNITAFDEVFPNRIPEDIYDSLEGQPKFIFVTTGPSPLNG